MPAESTDGDAAPVELQPPPIVGVFPSGEVELTGEINRPPDKDEPSGEIEGGVSSAQGSAAELTCKVSRSPGKSEKSTEVEMRAGMVKSGETHSQEDYSADKSNGEIDASKINLSPENEGPSAQKDNSADTFKSTAVVKSAEVEKHSQSQEDYSADESNAEIDASKIKLPPENEGPSAQKDNSADTFKSIAVVKSAEVEKHSQFQEDYSADKSNAEIDASKIKLSPENEESSTQKGESGETGKSTTVVKSAEVEKPSQSQVDYSADKCNGEIDASKIKLSPENEESSAMEELSQMENSVHNSNGEVDASKIKQSPENEKPSTQMENSAEADKYTAVEKSARMDKLHSETSELILRETGEFILRLDPTGTVSLMCLASPLYVVLALLALWLVADQPQALLWTFAHLVCLYLFCWVITLSTTRIRIVFLQITYVPMLAYTVVHLIAPMNGMMFLYTGMVYVAGMLGYAVAEHLQRTGFEQTANALCSTPFNSKDHEEKVSIMHFCTVLMSFPILARMAWVFLIPYGSHMTHWDVLRVVVELTAEIFILAVLWILYITEFILRGALVSAERVAWTASICWLASGSLSMLLSFYIAEAVGMLILWLGWMAIGGFFGYSLAVRACYCEMLTGSEKTPAAEEQNGGT